MSLQKPPLYAVHDELGASFTDFGGWEMPVEFDDIRTEHSAVREDVGIFDVSHMGQIEVTGPDAAELNANLVTNAVDEMDIGQGRYSAILNEDGHMIEDIIFYRLPDQDGEERYLGVPNAGNDEMIADRWRSYRDELGLDADVTITTEDYAMVAVQGPNAPEHVDAATEEDVLSLGRYEGMWATINGAEMWVARTGYTGEDGFEIAGPADKAESLWNAFDGVTPCGLGCRDTLRLEAGLLLSGQDFHPEEMPVTPIEAKLSFAVDLDHDFVGKDICADQIQNGTEKQLIGLKLNDRGVPRHGYTIESTDGEEIGEVTSGTMAPTLGEAIGLGYVDSSYAEEGTDINVMVRGNPKSATITSHRFLN